MSVFRPSSLILVILLGALLAKASIAADIEIDNPGWKDLPEHEKGEIVAKLKSAGVLGRDDVVVWKGNASSSTEEKNVGVGQILAEICLAKRLSEEERCAQKVGSERPKCREAELARQETAKTACDLSP